MPTTELTVRLPAEEVEFLEAYAREHGTTAAEILARYVIRFRANGHQPIHPDIVSITGLVPPDLEAKAEYRQHLLDKHKCRSRSTSTWSWMSCRTGSLTTRIRRMF